MPHNHDAAVYRDQGLLPAGWESIELETGGRKAWWHEDGGRRLATPIWLGDGGAETLIDKLMNYGLDDTRATLVATYLFERKDRGASPTPE